MSQSEKTALSGDFDRSHSLEFFGSTDLESLLTSKNQWDWDEIEKVLSDGERDAVLAALETVTQFAESVPQLLRRVVSLLAHPEDNVRRVAARAVGEFGVAAVDQIPTLITLAEGEDRAAGGGALMGLGAFGRHAPDRVLPTIRNALRSEDGQTREDAIVASRVMGPPAGPIVDDLFPLLEDDWPPPRSGFDMGANCLLVPRALAAIGEAAVPLVLARLEKERNSPSWGVLESLEGLGPLAKDALPALRELEASLEEQWKRLRLDRPEPPAPWIQKLPFFRPNWEQKKERYSREYQKRGLRNLDDRLRGSRRIIAAIEG